MRDALLLACVVFAAYLGFAFLALGQERNWQRLGTHWRFPGDASGLRVAGTAGLLLCLAASLARDGVAFGLILFATATSACALAVAFTLTWRAWLLRPLAAPFRHARKGE